MKSTRPAPARTPARPASGRHALRVLLALCLTGCNAPPQASPAAAGGSGADSAARPAPTSPAPTSPADAQAAAALFDEAIRADLDGDLWLAEERFIELAQRFPTTRHGRTARLRIGGGAGPFVLVGAAGIFAAIGVPAYIKYATRSKTTEASMNLRRAFDGSVAYFTEVRTDAQGNPLPARFPPSVGLTPPQTACIGTLSVPHVPDPTRWQHPTWQALGFAVDGPSLYQYEYVSAGEGSDASFTVRAVGDLDCDGVLSTFERSGSADADGNVNGFSGLFQVNELE